MRQSDVVCEIVVWGAAVRFCQLLRDFWVAAALSIVSIPAGSVAGAADDLLISVLQSRYAAMKTAMAAHDRAAIAAILAPDFVSVDVAGSSESADQMITAVNALKPDPNKSSETTLISVVPAASAVTVEQQYDMKTVKTAADGTQHKIEIVALSTDTWVKRADAWLMARTVTNELSYFKDGQLVGHKQKP